MKQRDEKYEKGLKDFFKEEKAIETFKNLQTTQEKLAFIWKSSSMQGFLNTNINQNFGKSEGDTKRFREFGNKQFKKGNDEEALKWFNKAIIKAEMNEKREGKDLSLGIANRSAALMKLGHLNEALEDAELSLRSGYPKELRYKLYERMVKIAVQLKDRAIYFDSLNNLKASLKDSGIDDAKQHQIEQNAEAFLQTLEKNCEPIKENSGITDATLLKTLKENSGFSKENSEVSPQISKQTLDQISEQTKDNSKISAESLLETLEQYSGPTKETSENSAETLLQTLKQYSEPVKDHSEMSDETLPNAIDQNSEPLKEKSNISVDVSSKTPEQNPEPPKENSKSASSLLSHELEKSHEHLPNMSIDVGLDYTPDKGRYAVANRNIPTGTVLLVEHPEARVGQDDEENLPRCDLCFSLIKLRYVPCMGCSNVIYCSEGCRDQALDCHRWECGNKDMFPGIIEQVSTSSGRTTGKFTSIRDYSRLCYRVICQQPAKWYRDNNDSFWARFPKFGDESWDKSTMHSVINLEAHHDMINPGRLWSFLLISLCHLRYLQISQYFGEPNSKLSPSLSQDELIVAGITVHMFQLMQFNTTCILENSSERRLLGNGLYPTLSLLNHSCDPNIMKYWVDDKVVVVASKDISENEEVTDCYFPSSATTSRDQRKAWLGAYYWYDCQCVACTDDLQTAEQMSNEPKNFRCNDSSCRGMVLKTTECPACETVVDAEKRKEEFNEINDGLEELEVLMSFYKDTISDELLDKVTEKWVRLQKLVRHPCRLLYAGNSLYQTAMGRKYGNKEFVS